MKKIGLAKRGRSSSNSIGFAQLTGDIAECG
jgi:hypothetical protein